MMRKSKKVALKDKTIGSLTPLVMASWEPIVAFSPPVVFARFFCACPKLLFVFTWLLFFSSAYSSSVHHQHPSIWIYCSLTLPTMIAIYQFTSQANNKFFSSFCLLFFLVSSNLTIAKCNIKIIADPPWLERRESTLSYFGVNASAYNRSYGRTPRPTTTRFASYPNAAPSMSSISRQKLLRYIKNPIFKRPNMDDLPVHVMLKLIPIKIQDLVEKNEVLETTLRLQVTWKDKRLAWDSKLFSDVTEIVIPGDLIWVPDVAILNSVSDLYHVVRDTRFEMKVESSGRIWWHPTGIVKTNCKLYLRYFPFDKQLCKFVFESPTFDLRFMNLTLRSNKKPVDTRMYTDGETWQLLGFNGRNIVNKVGTHTRFARVEFLIRIERAKIFHLLNVILPAIFLSTVQVMFFLLPSTHPQRVGSSTTTLLSVVVFQTVAVAQLPKTSTDIPLLSIYIFFVIIVSALSVGTSIIVAKFVVYAEEKISIPRWIASIPHPSPLLKSTLNSLFCWWRRRRRDSEAKPTHAFTPMDLHGPSSSTAKPSVYDTCTRITIDPEELHEAEKSAPALPPDDEAKTYRQAKQGRQPLFTSWSDISRFVDNTLMVIAVSIAVLSPLALFVIMPTLASDQHLVDGGHV